MPISYFFHLSILLIHFCFSSPSNGTVSYVDADATGNNDGSSWNDAYQRLENAIAAASPGDTLWIAQGTYRPSLDGDRSVSFHIEKPLALYGGFQGNETILQERDPANFITLLSGDIGLEGDSLDNSYRILTIENTNAPVTLDGLSIAHAVNNANTNNLVEQSAAGILVVNAEVHAYDLQVHHNTARYGGGLAAWSGTKWKASHCRFHQNRAYAFSDRCGGAAYAIDPNVQMDWLNCGFVSNRASNTSASGGGAVAGVQQATFTQCYFSQNQSEFGAAVSGAKATFYHCAFWGHPSAQGTLFDGQYTVNNSIFWFSFFNEPAASATATFNHCMLDVTDCPPGTDCNGCIYNQNPYFIDPLEEDFRVPLCAPSVDQGSAANLPDDLETDLGGLPRVIDGTPDIGPHEFLDPDPGIPGTHVINTRGDRYSRSFAGAIICANQHPGPDTIRFQLIPNAQNVISPKYNLPPVLDNATVIDATDQYELGEIIIDGSSGMVLENSLPGGGLRLFNKQQKVYGLDIRNFSSFGLSLERDSESAQIGLPGKPNVFFNNGTHIQVAGHQHTIQSNYLGCTPEGEMQTTGSRGIAIGSYSNIPHTTTDLTIGGSRALGEGNIIGNCSTAAIYSGANENNNTTDTIVFGAVIAGNTIGWHPILETAMPNQSGVWIYHSTFPGAPNSELYSEQITIGGPDADRGNIIAHSDGTAVFLEDDGVRVSMRRNRFFCNENGIVFLESPNFQKAPPVIQEADIFHISGTSLPGDTVEVLMNDTTSCPTAGCQGSIFLGEVIADDNGEWDLGSFPFPLFGGEQVTAIATNNHPVSSPFATCKTVICPESFADLNATRCANDSLVLQDQVFTVDHPSGEVVLVDSSAIGCDSIISVNVNFLPLGVGNFSGTYCSNESISIGNTTFDTDFPEGTALIAGASANSCDSLVEVSLTFLEAPVTSAVAEICPGDTLVFGSHLISTSGTFTDTLTAINGCDSLSQLVVMLLSQPVTQLEAFACPGESFVFQDSVLTEPGVYTFSAPGANGCDSILLLDFQLLESYEITEQATLCTGDSLIFCNTLVTTPGTYFCELISTEGCDSTTVLEVQEAFPQATSIDTLLCAGQPLNIAGNTFQDPGQYEVSLMSAEGCDSILQITLAFAEPAVPEVEVLPDFGGGTGSVHPILSDSTLNFSWEDGAEDLERSNLDSGTYILLLEDTLGCVWEWPIEVPSGMFKFAVPNTFTPNGDGQNDTFAPLTNTDQYQLEQFEIYNRWGQLVFKSSPGENSWDGTYQSKPQPSEVYFYQIQIRPNTSTGAPVTLRGDVTLIR